MRPILTTLTAAAAALAVTAAPAAGAARGGGTKPSSTSTVSLVVLTGDDAAPNWGEQVSFDVSTTATTQPHLNLACSQNGTTVYTATTGYYAGYPWPWTQTMTLSSGAWTGGAANCVATVYMLTPKGNKTLATLSFTVAA
jgi:hypothetical protein